MTDIARQEIKSWRQLPVNFYQIQTKFRDERRPRFGVMRGRDFVMKDAYSFDRTAEDAGKSYDKMFEAYCRTLIAWVWFIVQCALTPAPSAALALRNSR